MLQYLVILLDDTSTSFCHYNTNKQERKLMPLDVLRKGIYFGMTENLRIQLVYPDYELPVEHNKIIETVDHTKIKPIRDGADIWVGNQLDMDTEYPPIAVLRTNKQSLFHNEANIIQAIEKLSRLNIVLTDIDTFTDEDFSKYKLFLERFLPKLEQLYVNGHAIQLSLLTDRMMLAEMNNCGAGDTTITLAPNGRFYICPAFYNEDENNNVGNLENGLNIKNKQLYKLQYAPICSHCDAFQCKRCIWLNRKNTMEVNIPSHEQCVMAHLERNASRKLMNNIRKHGIFLPEYEEIKEIDYLDPFDKRDEWL